MISLLDVAHQEAQRLVRSGAPVYLTVNPVEYHGPHLSLHNDRLISLGIVRQLHERLQARHGWPLPAPPARSQAASRWAARSRPSRRARP